VASSVGPRFVEAVVARDESAVAACFGASAAFRALIPPGVRERTGANDAAALIVGWFADSTELELVESRTEEVGDRLHVAYRVEGVEDGEQYVVEQHLFCTLDSGLIERADLLCSGFRPRDRE
jgi:hypothetical protein